jgi:hypothetical protein
MALPPFTPTGGRDAYWEKGPKAHLRITCPHGHHIPCNSVAPDDGANYVRCTKWVGGQDCGEWRVVLRFRGGGVLVVSVSKEEVDEYSTAHVTPAALLHALGIFDQLKRGA